jgi:dienelactone hydrolase
MMFPSCPTSSPSQTVESCTIDYAAGGRRFAGWLVHDAARGGKRPGILVCHEGSGLGDHTKERAAMLAELGYVALAPDLFGETFRSREHGIAIISGLLKDPTALRERTNAALDLLRSHDRVDPARTAVIGFCFGGLAALELARSGRDLGCVVSFHGGLQTALPAQPAGVRCKVLACVGAEDPFIPPEQRAAFEDEMRHAGADWQVIVYGEARHGFTNRRIDPDKSPGSAYHAPTDQRSWLAMRNLLDETMGAI